jgi:LysR family carnitine catabolism transcriptional activator
MIGGLLTIARPGPMHHVTIKHLRAFRSVARFSSFTRAAEQLHMSQPALTMTIRQLESSLGISLFDRTTRSVILTPEGTDFLPLAERLVSDFDLAIQDMRAAATRRRGRIGVAAVYSVATKLLPSAISVFSERHPGVRLHLRDGNSSDVLRRVSRNEVDIGYASVDGNEGELDAVPLFRDQMGLLLRADHPLCRINRTLRWKDLDGFDFIGLAYGTATRPILDQIPDLPQSVVAPRYEVSNTTTMWAMVELGTGISTVPALSAPTSAQNVFRFRRLTHPVMWRTVCAVTRKGRSLSPAALEFSKLVAEYLGTIFRNDRQVELLAKRP